MSAVPRVVTGPRRASWRALTVSQIADQLSDGPSRPGMHVRQCLHDLLTISEIPHWFIVLFISRTQHLLELKRF